MVERHTSPVELLWDPVFVFAVTQVTTLLSHDLSWAGFGRGMLLLALVWWSWSAFVWDLAARQGVRIQRQMQQPDTGVAAREQQGPVAECLRQSKTGDEREHHPAWLTRERTGDPSMPVWSPGSRWVY